MPRTCSSSPKLRHWPRNIRATGNGAKNSVMSTTNAARHGGNHQTSRRPRRRAAANRAGAAAPPAGVFTRIGTLRARSVPRLTPHLYRHLLARVELALKELKGHRITALRQRGIVAMAFVAQRKLK